jgi:hypothetical protein
MKIEIIESPYKPATKQSVCSHLAPIVQLMEKHGAKLDWTTGLIPDKAAGNILLSETEIDFKLIEEKVNIPDYINIDPNRKIIFCKKCWCGIEKKDLGKVYNSSVQPK